MGAYPIDSTSLSFNDIKQNIIDFVQSKPDANRWRDFYTGGEGTILIELIAGYGFYTALKIIFSREETYLQYVNTLLSARAIALNLAYSAFRGTNRRYKVKFTPSVTAVIPAYTVIGYQGDYDFIALGYVQVNEDGTETLVEGEVRLNEGREVVVYGAVGSFASLSLEAPSSDLHVFRFNDSAISNDYKLFLNDEEVPTTSINRESLEDKYLVQSNAVGGVNATYLNIQEGFTHKYRTGDVLRLDFIRYQDIPYSKEIFIDYAESNEIEVIATENTVFPETIESIQTKAPIMYETQQLIRSREDYVKNFLQLGTKFVDTTGRDLSAAYVELSYVQSDRMILTDAEESEIFKALTYSRMFGIPMPYINKPKSMRIKLNIELKLISANIVEAVYNAIVDRVFSYATYKFSDMLEEVKIDLAESERLLEAEANVKRAYVSYQLTPFAQQEFYQLGDVIYDASKHPDVLYRVTDVTYTTLAKEPNWNYELYSITEDGNVWWQAVPQSGAPSRWASQEDVCMYDLRLPTKPKKEGIMFRAVKGKSVSAPSEEPEWNVGLGSITYDNELIWLCIENVATAPKWDVNTWYSPGDIIQAESMSFQVIGERRRSTNIPPDFTDEPETIIYENMVLSKEVLEDEQISIPWGTYCVLDPVITLKV